jgi:hypothetical protein
VIERLNVYKNKIREMAEIELPAIKSDRKVEGQLGKNYYREALKTATS